MQGRGHRVQYRLEYAEEVSRKKKAVGKKILDELSLKDAEHL
jgi:hypothetical protein